jgi:hypothetical protein
MKRSASRKDPALEAIQLGWRMVAAHPLFAAMGRGGPERSSSVPADGWATIDSVGDIRVHLSRRGTPEEWAWVLLTC